MEEKQNNTAEKELGFCYYEKLYMLRTEKRLSLEQVFNQVRGPQLRHATGEIRRAIAEGNPEKAKTQKMQLPAIAVSCDFPEERRKEQAGDYLAYALVDCDNLPCPPSEYRDRCRVFPFVALAHVSASGDGVHILVPVGTGVERHEATCISLQNFFESAFGYPTDHSCIDITRTALLCHDPDCYYNPDAIAWHVPEERRVAEKKPPCHPSSGSEADRIRNYLDEADRGLSWVKGQRHSNLLKLLYSLNRAGFDERTVTSECISRYVQPDFSEKEIAKVISYTYTAKRAEHGCNRKEFTSYASSRQVVECPVSADSADSASSIPLSDEVDPNVLKSNRLNKAMEMTQCFPPAVYEHLPSLLQDMFTEGLTDVERSVVLMGSLGIFSAAMPCVRGSYQDATYEPPLYCCVVGAASSGKGVLNRIHPVFHKYAEKVRKDSERAVRGYKNEMKRYSMEMVKQAKTNGKLPEEPERVEQKELELAGNISRPRLVELLSFNGYYTALMLETEIDVLNNSMEQEHGQFHDLANQIFQHEQISKDTKQDKRFTHLFPRMSMVLSGTVRQMTRFIYSAEDGLFSRFLSFYISGQSEWKPLTDRDNTPKHGNYYASLGNVLLETALHLEQYPTWVSYEDHQRDWMNEVFPRELERLRNFGEDERSSLLFRLGLIHFRICMILTGLRKGEKRLIDPEMKIRDDDFHTADLIVFHCLKHALVLSTLLKKDPVLEPIADPMSSEQLFNELGENFTTKEALKKGENLGMGKRTIETALFRWCKSKMITRVMLGKYKRNVLKVKQK